MAFAFRDALIGAAVSGAVVVGATVAPSAAPSESRCPGGWDYNSYVIQDATIESCAQDPWVVVLHPDGSFNYGLNTGDPTAVEQFDPQAVPGWDN
jgi:hypothetical protein